MVSHQVLYSTLNKMVLQGMYVQISYLQTMNMKLMNNSIVIGASLSEPHTSELVLKNLLRCMYVCMYVSIFATYVVRSGTVLIRIYLRWWESVKNNARIN